MRPAVVKLGGSLAGSPALRDWLALLAEKRPRRVAIVAGGGPFADAVRAAQTPLGFSDSAGHRMAIMAMEQYAVALADREPRLRLAGTAAEFEGAALWLPSRMTFGRPEIPETWSVTSDSLAAWLAREIGADRLILVKSTEVGGTLPELVSRGVLDEAFPDFAERFPGDIRCVGPHAFAEVRALLGTA